MGKRVPVALALLAIVLAIAPATGSAGTILPPIYKVNGIASYVHEGAENDFDVNAPVKSITYPGGDVVLGSGASLQFHADLIEFNGLKATFAGSAGDFLIASAGKTYLTGQIESLIVKPAYRDGTLKAKAFVDITGGDDAALFTGASAKMLAFVFDLDGGSDKNVSFDDNLWLKNWAADFQGLFGRISKSCREPEPNAVPEPATALLLIPGVLGLAFRGMRKR